MNPDLDHSLLERIQAYLDGTLSPSEIARLEQECHERGVDLSVWRGFDGQVEAVLRRKFHPPKFPAQQFALWLDQIDQTAEDDQAAEELASSHSAAPLDVPTPTVEGKPKGRAEAVSAGPRSRRGTTSTSSRRTTPVVRSKSVYWAALAAVAAIACLLISQNWQSKTKRPFFAAESLADVYRTAVEHGFRPYYHCEDEDRFVATFQQRLHQPLRLADLPADRRMLGLSYSGGISRDTTAILCRVGSDPVMVFVDRRQVPQPPIVQSNKGTLHIFERIHGDLVLYEVTPRSSPSFLDYLQ